MALKDILGSGVLGGIPAAFADNPKRMLGVAGDLYDKYIGKDDKGLEAAKNEAAAKEAALKDAASKEMAMIARQYRANQPTSDGGVGGYSSYKKGGKVSSASKRADGCAVRGKTKGKMY